MACIGISNVLMQLAVLRWLLLYNDIFPSIIGGGVVHWQHIELTELSHEFSNNV